MVACRKVKGSVKCNNLEKKKTKKGVGRDRKLSGLTTEDLDEGLMLLGLFNVFPSP